MIPPDEVRNTMHAATRSAARLRRLGLAAMSCILMMAFFSNATAQTVLPNGGVISDAISVPFETDVYTFTATVGDSVQIRVADTSDGPFTPQLTLVRPDTTLVTADSGTTVTHIDCPTGVCTIDQTGTYTVVVSDNSTTGINDDETGTYDIYFVRMPGANENGALVNGGVVSGEIDLGDLDSYTFAAVAGESVQIRIADTSGGPFDPEITLYAPDGSLITSDSGDAVAHIDCPTGVCTIDQTGTYTVVVADNSSNGSNDDETGSYDIYFVRLPGANENGALVNGGVVSDDIALGDLDSYTFAAVAGESVQIRIADLSGGPFDPQITLYAPDGSLITSSTGDAVAHIDCPTGVCTIDQTGTYTVVVADNSSNGTGDDEVGSYNVHFVRMPGANESGALINGGFVSGDIALGDLDSYTFAAVAGESVQIRIADLSGGPFDPQITLYAPDGSLITSSTGDAVAHIDCPTGVCTIDQTGTYTVVVADNSSNGTGDDEVGSYNVHFVRMPGANESGALVNGGFVSGDIELGDLDSYTFAAVAGESVQIRIVDTSGGPFDPQITLFAPDGSLITSNTGATVTHIDCPTGVCTIDQTGTYTVVVADNSSNGTGDDEVGTYDVHFVRMPGANEGGSLVNGGVISGIIDVGDLDSYTFEASVGESVQIRIADTSGGSFVPQITLYRPDGSLITSNWSAVVTHIDCPTGVCTIDQTGTYTVVVSDNSSNGDDDDEAGSYDLYFVRAPGANEGGSLTDGATLAGFIDLGDLDSFTFLANAGDGVQIRVTDTSGGAFSPQVVLYRPDGALITSDSNGDEASISCPTGTCAIEQTGAYTVVVTDNSSNSDNDDEIGSYNIFDIDRVGGGGAPTITSSPVTTATEGELYLYDVAATDPDAGDTLTFSLDLAPAGMTIDTASGLIQWTPAVTQLGDNAVTVRVTDDGGLSDTQTFTVTVVDDNLAPTITSTPVTSATVGDLYTYDVAAIDPNVGDTLTFSLDLAPAGMTIDTASGLIQWTPAVTQLGDNAVTVRVTDDGGLSDTQTFTVTVVDDNLAPTITSTPVTDATVDDLYVYDVAAIDPNVGDTLTFSLDLAPAGMTIDTASGLIQWTPAVTQLGDNAVTVRVTDDGGLSDTQTFTVTVVDDNLAPTITSTPVTDATVDDPYAYDVAAIDPNVGDTLTFSLDLAPAGMTIDTASGLIQWTPAGTQLGDNAVTVRVTDDGGLSDTQTFTVTVVDDNLAPTITSTPVTDATVDDLYVYDVAAIDPNVGDTLTFSLDLAPAGMTIATASGLIQWTPAGTQLGDNAVTVRVTDDGGLSDTQTFTVTVVDDNLAPTITSTPVTDATVDDLYVYDVAAIDPNVGDTLTFSLDLAPAGMTIATASGLIQWTPAGTQLGDNAVTVRVTDDGGLSDTQTFTVTVVDDNLAPTITSTPVTDATVDDLYVYDVAAIDPNVGDTLTFSLDLAPAGMTIATASGLIQWTPAGTQLGDNAVTVRVTDDGGLSDTQTFTVTVVDDNLPPMFILPIDDRDVNEGDLLEFTVEAEDPEGDDIRFEASDLPPGAMFVDNLDDRSATFRWTPGFDQMGNFEVILTVFDDQVPPGRDDVVVRISVGDVNRPPEFIPRGDETRDVGEGSLLTIVLEAIDPDGDDISFPEPALPDGAVFIDNRDGTALFSWTPAFDQMGVFPIVFIVNDDGDPMLNDIKTITIAVGDVNRPPVLDPIGDRTAPIGDVLEITVTASDPDVGDALSFDIVGLPGGATFSDNGDGTATLRWDPVIGPSGDTAPITIEVMDDGVPVESDSETFVISVGRLRGDVDMDGDVDRDDVRLILAARNEPASGPDDPRDLDGDGVITVLDARIDVTLCTRPRCSTI